MKTVLITGSSRGIGLEIAKCFSESGYRIVMNCIRNEDRMNEEVYLMKKANKNVIGIKADVSKYDEVENMFDRIGKHFGDVDILINNAGISYVGLFTEMDPKEWNHILETNINSMFNCTKLALPSMISRKSGAIINISSIWGNVGASCEVVYSSTKGAVNGFTKALAKEVGPCNIKVNAVACGVIDTEMNSFLSEEEKSNITEEIALCRFGKAREVANAVFFLASDQCDFLTGQVIVLDGAML